MTVSPLPDHSVFMASELVNRKIREKKKRQMPTMAINNAG